MLKGMARQKAPIVFKSGEPVSIICVASTFTSLSYANNGGKVQLSSAGVHGLTTSPAVGAKVYVSWVGGTGISGLYTVLSVDSTTAITVDLVHVAGLGTPSVAIANTLVDVATLNIPMLSDDSEIRCSMMATVPKTTSTRAIYARLNNSNSARVSIYIASASVGSLRFLGTIKNRGSANSQISSGHVSLSGSSTEPFIEATINTATNNNTISISVLGSLYNEVLKVEQYLIEVFI